MAAGGADYYDFLTDFRHGGFRMLGDLLCDMDDLATARAEAAPPPGRFGLPEDDGPHLSAPLQRQTSGPWCLKVCRKLLNKIIRPSLAVPYVVALGKREPAVGPAAGSHPRNMFWRWTMLNEWKEFQDYAGAVKLPPGTNRTPPIWAGSHFDTIHLDFGDSTGC